MKSAGCIKSSAIVLTVATCAVVIYVTYDSGNISSSKDLLYNYRSVSERLTEEECIPVCDTKDCVYQSEVLQKFMNQSVDPCDNFHEYVCGGIYERGNPFESDDIFRRNTKRMSLILKNVLDSIDGSPNSASRKLKSVYVSCIKESSSEVRALPTVLQFLSILGIPNWPNIDHDFKFYEPSVAEVISRFLTYQEYAFIEFTQENFIYDSSDINEKFNVTLKISSCSENACYESYEKSARKYMINRIFSYFNMNPQTITGIWEESEAIRVAIINLKEESERVSENEAYLSGEILDCTTKDNENNTNELCQILESTINATNSEEHVNKNFARLDTSDLYFMWNIFTVLRNFSDRSVANYLAINLILNNMNELNFYFQQTREKIDLIKQPMGFLMKKNLRWERCVDWITNRMTLALGHEYMKKELTVPMTDEVKGLMIECIHEAKELINHQEWLSQDVRKIMDERFGKLLNGTSDLQELIVGIFTDETTVNNFYENFLPSEDNFLQNVLEYRKYVKTISMLGLNYGDYGPDFLKEKFSANADGSREDVDVHFGLLLPPSYTFRIQRVLNLAAIGVHVSHEIGHFVKENMDDLVKSDLDANVYYRKKLQCLVNQYSNFTIESIGKKLNGSKTLRENFSDLVSISVIDKIVKKYFINETTFYLPSLSLPVDQQIYLSAAHSLCSVQTREEDELQHKFDSHSINKFRILGMTLNSEGFSKAFGCQNGSYMNPLSKCKTFFK